MSEALDTIEKIVQNNDNDIDQQEFYDFLSEISDINIENKKNLIESIDNSLEDGALKQSLKESFNSYMEEYLTKQKTGKIDNSVNEYMDGDIDNLYLAYAYFFPGEFKIDKNRINKYFSSTVAHLNLRRRAIYIEYYNNLSENEKQELFDDNLSEEEKIDKLTEIGETFNKYNINVTASNFSEFLFSNDNDLKINKQEYKQHKEKYGWQQYLSDGYRKIKEGQTDKEAYLDSIIKEDIIKDIKEVFSKILSGEKAIYNFYGNYESYGEGFSGLENVINKKLNNLSFEDIINNKAFKVILGEEYNDDIDNNQLLEKAKEKLEDIGLGTKEELQNKAFDLYEKIKENNNIKDLFLSITEDGAIRSNNRNNNNIYFNHNKNTINREYLYNMVMLQSENLRSTTSQISGFNNYAEKIPMREIDNILNIKVLDNIKKEGKEKLLTGLKNYQGRQQRDKVNNLLQKLENNNEFGHMEICYLILNTNYGENIKGNINIPDNKLKRELLKLYIDKFEKNEDSNHKRVSSFIKKEIINDPRYSSKLQSNADNAYNEFVNNKESADKNLLNNFQDYIKNNLKYNLKNQLEESLGISIDTNNKDLDRSIERLFNYYVLQNTENTNYLIKNIQNGNISKEGIKYTIDTIRKGGKEAYIEAVKVKNEYSSFSTELGNLYLDLQKIIKQQTSQFKGLEKDINTQEKKESIMNIIINGLNEYNQTTSITALSRYKQDVKGMEGKKAQNEIIDNTLLWQIKESGRIENLKNLINDTEIKIDKNGNGKIGIEEIKNFLKEVDEKVGYDNLNDDKKETYDYFNNIVKKQQLMNLYGDISGDFEKNLLDMSDSEVNKLTSTIKNISLLVLPVGLSLAFSKVLLQCSSVLSTVTANIGFEKIQSGKVSEQELIDNIAIGIFAGLTGGAITSASKHMKTILGASSFMEGITVTQGNIKKLSKMYATMRLRTTSNAALQAIGSN